MKSSLAHVIASLLILSLLVTSSKATIPTISSSVSVERSDESYSPVTIDHKESTTNPDSQMGPLQEETTSMNRQTLHYIFGYGSLICSKSRKISAPTLTKLAIPVIVNDIRRTWTARVGRPSHRSPEQIHDTIHGQTAMGIQRSRGHRCTGVLIEVNQQELANFDLRERGYDRVEVELHHVFPHDDDSYKYNVIRKASESREKNELCNSDDNYDERDVTNKQNAQCIVKDDDDGIDVKVWVYLPHKGGTGADHNYPIMQSYVDIILRGCMSIGKEFALSFLESTHGWWHDHSIHGHTEAPEYLWLDDRDDPYYVRADEEWSREMKHLIDEIIREVHREPFEKRRHLNTLNRLL